ncbi:STAS domain-containing protein [Blastococcus sp. TF02A-30]|uniref:STAS domain-containing protein n=1 Tax=Blastococcus sp. TF02A-30 TaxID=2250580 RepID=UPI000DE8D08C|nr:STAS domain-containing protein [Blastococcus sp. TF02A-30]RBY91016.1 anti-sigma factor antagonist [Blastococcus sp. TF02A-30]
MTATLEPPTSDLVTVDVLPDATGILVAVSGEVDSSSAPVLAHHLDTVLETSPAAVTVDLRGVTFLDSAGLSTLAMAHRRAEAAGGRVRVVASSRAVVRPLQITGLWDLLSAEQVADSSAERGIA